MHNNMRLAISYIKYYRKQAAILFLGICMSVLLMNGIASLVYSNQNASYENAKEEYGSWNYAIPKNRIDENKIIRSDSEYELNRMGVCYSAPCEATGKDITFCYGDIQYLEMNHRTLLEGTYPGHKNEIALDYYALHNLGMDYALGSTLELRGERFTLTGIVSEGAKTADNSILIFTDKETVLDMDEASFLYLEFSDAKRAYEQFSAFLQKNRISCPDPEMNDGISIYIGAEPKETIMDIIQKLKNIDYINPEDIPNIDLYMDQVTTFMDEHLAACKRMDDDKILTKTMINNYTKNDFLPPPIKKKYSKEHMYLLIFLYYFKNVLSITDIQKIFRPLTDMFYNGKSRDINLEDIYRMIFNMERIQTDNLTKDILRRLKASQDLFPDVKDEKEADFLSRFAFICLLTLDVYLKKQIVERMIDETLSDYKKEKKDK